MKEKERKVEGFHVQFKSWWHHTNQTKRWKEQNKRKTD